MADFLSHLAQRLDDSPIAVRPRLPAMFEAPPDDALPDDRIGHARRMVDSLEESFADPPEADGPDVESRQHRRRDARVTPQRRVHQTMPPDAQLPENVVPDEGVHHAAVREVVDDRPRYSEASSRVSERQARKSDVGPMPAAPQRASHGVATRGSLSVRREPERPEYRSTPEPPRDIESITPPSTLRDAGPRPAIAAVVRATAMRPEAHDAPASNPAASLRPRAEPPSPRATAARIATQAAMPAAEPVIRVTIGRIEVRATVASAPAAKKPSGTSPVMALDDYLRSRTEGGRR